MIASAPSQARAASAARILGTMPPRDDAGVDERLGLAATVSVSSRWPSASRTPSTSVSRTSWRAPRPGGDPGRDVVGVDVADDAVLVAGERRDDRHLAADEDRVEEVAAEADDVGDEPDARDALGDRAGRRRRRTARPASTPRSRRPGDELAVDDAAEDRGGDLERRRVGHAEAALEARRDAQPLEPLGDPPAAAVDEDDGTATRDRGDLVEDLGWSAIVVPPSLTTRISLTSCTPSSR